MGYGFIYSDIFDDVPEEERSPQMIAIYSYLCSRAGAKGECWVGHKNIMKHTGIKSKMTVIKYLKDLEYFGMIEIEKRKKDANTNMTNIYRINALKGSTTDIPPSTSNRLPSTTDIPPSTSNRLPSTTDVPPLVHSVDYPSTSDDTQIITNNNNNLIITENSSSREAKPHSYDTTTTTTEIIDRLNKKSGNQFKATPKILAQVKGLLEAGYTAKDVNLVVDTKVPQFLAEGKDYLVQPSKLFDVDRFDDYLQESLNGISQYQKANQPRKRIVHPEWEGKPKQQQQQLTPEEVSANEEAMRKQLNDQLKHLRAN